MTTAASRYMERPSELVAAVVLEYIRFVMIAPQPSRVAFRRVAVLTTALLLSACLRPTRVNSVAHYLAGAEHQSETLDQRLEIRRALQDTLDLSAEQLRHRRYADYTLKPESWTLPELLHGYFLPAQPSSLDNEHFYRDVKADPAQEAIRQQLKSVERAISEERQHEIIQGPQQQPVLTLETRDEFEDVYSWRAGECRISWHIYKGVNAGVARFHFDAAPATGVCIPELGKTLARMKQVHGGHLPFHTLTQERLLEAEGLHPQQMARSLVIAAIQASEWDTQKGMPKRGGINDFVRALGNSAEIHRDYRQVFSSQGYRLEISAVEKVLVARIRELPFSLNADLSSISREALVPYDAIIWFSMTPQ